MSPSFISARSFFPSLLENHQAHTSLYFSSPVDPRLNRKLLFMTAFLRNAQHDEQIDLCQAQGSGQLNPPLSASPTLTPLPILHHLISVLLSIYSVDSPLLRPVTPDGDRERCLPSLICLFLMRCLCVGVRDVWAKNVGVTLTLCFTCGLM